MNYINSKGHTLITSLLYILWLPVLLNIVLAVVFAHAAAMPSFLTLCLGVHCWKSETSHRQFRQLYLSSQWCHQSWLEASSLVYLKEPSARHIWTHSDWIRPAGGHGLWPGREDVLKGLLTTYSFVLLHPTFFFMLKFFMFKAIISEQVKLILVRYFWALTVKDLVLVLLIAFSFFSFLKHY